MAAPKKKPVAARKETSPEGPFALVWGIVNRVPRGRVVTYGRLSAMIDRRLSSVGIGWALRAAPEDAIPWHRVVNSRGGISTDREHPGLQRAMLEAEGVVFDRAGHMDLARYGWGAAKESRAKRAPRDGARAHTTAKSARRKRTRKS